MNRGQTTHQALITLARCRCDTLGATPPLLVVRNTTGVDGLTRQA